MACGGGHAARQGGWGKGKIGRGSVRFAPAHFEFLGLDPWDKPEDDCARGASWGSGEPPRASVSGFLRGVFNKARCSDGAGVKFDISLYSLWFSYLKKLSKHRIKSCASGSYRSLRGKMAAMVENLGI